MKFQIAISKSITGQLVICKNITGQKHLNTLPKSIDERGDGISTWK